MEAMLARRQINTWKIQMLEILIENLKIDSEVALNGDMTHGQEAQIAEDCLEAAEVIARIFKLMQEMRDVMLTRRQMYSPEPRKLDAAVTWRQNETILEDMITSAIAKADKFLEPAQ